MHSKASLMLFITSFVPVAVFKVVSRVGNASLAQGRFPNHQRTYDMLIRHTKHGLNSLYT
jgi:hypothetical protein